MGGHAKHMLVPGAMLVLAGILLALPAWGHGDDMKERGDMNMPASPRNYTVSEAEERAKRQFLLIAHALIASAVAFVTLPISIALVAGRKIEHHRNLSSVNTLMMGFVGLIAMVGFADGDSWHAKIAIACLVFWLAQAGYGWVRQNYYRKLNIFPHRFFGIALFTFTMMAWASGVLHVLGSCNAASDVQICNAHFYLGALFVIVGLVNGYYAPEFAAKVEMSLMALGGVSELVGEGVVDSILHAIDPVTFTWDSMAKFVHLSTATIWVLCALTGWALAIWRPATLPRGIGVTIGCAFHIAFMMSHGGEAEPRTRAGHALHELALVPILFLRPTMRLPGLRQYLLIVSGFAFIMAADTVTRDVQDVSPPTYIFLAILFASIFHAVHRFIQLFILRKEPAETMLERTGWAAPVYCVIRCLGRLCCCCPSLSVDQGDISKLTEPSKYQHLETQVSPDEENSLRANIDEDVTSVPKV